MGRHVETPWQGQPWQRSCSHRGESTPLLSPNLLPAPARFLAGVQKAELSPTGRSVWATFLWTQSHQRAPGKQPY